MRETGSDCVGCDLPCRGSACPYHGTYTRYYCDVCGKEIKMEDSEGMYRLDADRDVCLKCYVKAKAKQFVEDNWGDDAFMELLEDWADIDRYALEEDDEGDDEE